MNKSLLYFTLCALILSLSFFVGCKSLFGGDDEVWIRIKNSSSYSMQDIKVNFTGDEFSYGDLASSEESEYQSVGEAYRYAYVETEVEEKKIMLVPIDYVGATLLKPGKYTYVLSIDEEVFQSDDYDHALALELKKP